MGRTRTAGRLRSDDNRVTVILPDAVRSLGARVWLEGAGAKYTREVASASGLGTDQTSALVFGLGRGTHAERLVIAWADGSQTVFDHPPVNRPFRIGGHVTGAALDSEIHFAANSAKEHPQ